MATPGPAADSRRAPVVLVAAVALGGPGAVAERARAELRAGAQAGAHMVGVTDGLRAPIAGLEIHSSAPRSVLGILPGAMGELAAVTALTPVLQRAARALAPDEIVFHSSTLAWPAIRIAHRHGARAIFVVHALIQDRIDNGVNPYGSMTTRVYVRANRAALLGSDRVVCVSDHMASLATRAGVPGVRLRVLSNPVSLDRFRPTAEVTKDIDLLFVGRHSVEKGIDTLIRAAAGLSDVRTVLVGDGPEQAQLRRLAADVAADVEFTGWRSADEVAALMQRSRLLVVPSRSEPQGVVVLEGLAAGLAVVAARVGGIPEIVSDGENGWLVPADDPQALRAAIVGALADPARLLEMGRRARESVAQYGSDVLVRGFADAYL